jgi:hypothetical protein
VFILIIANMAAVRIFGILGALKKLKKKLENV